MTLWPALPFNPEETLLSYADRLSVMHTGRGMKRLVRDFGINTEHFTSGHIDAVAVFADATGLPLVDLQQASVRVLRSCASFRGDDISKLFLSPRAARYCPTCLEEDGDRADWRFRLIWGFHHVARCDLHALWLVDAPTSNETNLRLALGTSELGEAQTVHAETPDYLSWLRARIHSSADGKNKWMDGQTIEQVLAASEMLGSILQHGHKVAITKLKPGETEEATDIGFSIYAEGPEAIEEALDTIRQTSTATAVQAGPLALYGSLFNWLDRRCNAINPGPIRDILRDHIVKHSAVEPGTRVLGVEITERRYHTLYSLSAAVGVERPRLSRLLKKLGEIPMDATEVESGTMVFEAAKSVRLIEAFATAIPLRDVPAYLCATQNQVEILYRVGLVHPLIPRAGRGSVRHVVFARSHLDELLNKVTELPVLDETAAGEFHPISYACQRGAGRFEDLLADVLDGKVQGYLRFDKVGIGAIEVDVRSLIAMKKSA